MEQNTLYLLCLNCKSEEALLFIDKHPESCFANYIYNDYTTLMIACSNGLEGVALRIIEVYGVNCNPNYANKNGYNIFHISLLKKLLSVANRIIDKFYTAFKSDQLTVDGYSILYCACLMNYESLAFKIIDTYGDNCKPDQISIDTHTPLTLVCKLKLSLIAEKLIDTFGVKCNINHKYRNKYTALDLAKKHMLTNVIDKIGRQTFLKLYNTSDINCSICYNEFNEFSNKKIMLNCGHSCICKKCSLLITNCPICKSKITAKYELV